MKGVERYIDSLQGWERERERERETEKEMERDESILQNLQDWEGGEEILCLKIGNKIHKR